MNYLTSHTPLSPSWCSTALVSMMSISMSLCVGNGRQQGWCGRLQPPLADPGAFNCCYSQVKSASVHRKLSCRTSSNGIARRRRSSGRKLFCVASAAAAAATETEEVEGKEEGEGEKFDWFSQWYPVAPEHELDKKVPHAFTVLGIEIVVWWDRHAKQWIVFDDKCPHRLAPLSEGRIAEDGTLQCCYHGWCFSPRGNCTYIPQLPRDGPPAHTSKRAYVSIYPSILQQGIVWFWPSTVQKLDNILSDKKPPIIPGLSDPSFQCHLPAMRDLPYGYEILVENLVDPSHVPYAHYGLVSTGGGTENHQKAGTPLDMSLQRLDLAGFEVDTRNGGWTFIAPCTIIGLKERGPKNHEGDGEKKKVKATYLIFLCVPVSPCRSRVIWAFPRNFALWLDIVIPRWLNHLPNLLIFDSDLYMLHIEEKKLQNEGTRSWGKACYVPASADMAVVAFRKWLRKYTDNIIYQGNNPNVSLLLDVPKEHLMDRYWSHVVKCRSCTGALKVFQMLEKATQVLSILFVGLISIIGASRQMSSVSLIWGRVLVTLAVVCWMISWWLSKFIYRSYYFHDYNHAYVH